MQNFWNRPKKQLPAEPVIIDFKLEEIQIPCRLVGWAPRSRTAEALDSQYRKINRQNAVKEKLLRSIM